MKHAVKRIRHFVEGPRVPAKGGAAREVGA